MTEYDPSQQYRCTITRGKSISRMDDYLPIYAEILKEICPIPSKAFKIKFDTELTKQFKKLEYVNFDPSLEKTGINELDSKLREVYTNDEKNGHKHSFITYRYFLEMESHFQSMNNILISGTHYIVVIGDSSVSNINFETTDFLIKLAERNGFTLYNKWGYEIKNRFMNFNRQGRGGIIEIDWVLDFIKT